MIIVIHPGSLNLRMGRASDLNPHRTLHAVARRRKPGGQVHHDTILPKILPKVRPNFISGNFRKLISSPFGPRIKTCSRNWKIAV